MAKVANGIIKMGHFGTRFGERTPSEDALENGNIDCTNFHHTSNLSPYNTAPSCSNSSSTLNPLPQLSITPPSSQDSASGNTSSNCSLSPAALSPGPQYSPHPASVYDNCAMINDDEDLLSHYFDQKPIRCTGVLRLDEPDFLPAGAFPSSHQHHGNTGENNTGWCSRGRQNNSFRQAQNGGSYGVTRNSGSSLLAMTTFGQNGQPNHCHPSTTTVLPNNLPQARKFSDTISVVLILFIALLWLLIAIVDIKTPLLADKNSKTTAAIAAATPAALVSLEQMSSSAMPILADDTPSSTIDDMNGDNHTGHREKVVTAMRKKLAITSRVNEKKKADELV